MSTILVGIFVAVLFVFPFILLGRNKNKGGKQLKVALSNIAKDNNCTITISECMTGSAIGLDENTNHLFFVHTFNGKETIQNLFLNDFQNCEVKNISRKIKTSKGNLSAIEKIKLAFIPLDKNNPTVDLELFNSDENTSFTDELMVTEKWAKIINKRMEKKK
jgi:hypothetical protein